MAMANTYIDILHCHRPVSRHLRMDRGRRAKQFAPFAALKGHEDAVRRREIIYDTYMPLSEEQLTMLDRQIHQIQVPDIVTVTWFVPAPGRHPLDGHYHTITGPLTLLDMKGRRLCVDGTPISFRQITDIST